jgi:RNA polymerase sigma-70 factor (ECF subfamily)
VASDLELWQAWIAGDRAAGNELVARHFVGIYRFFASKVPDHAEELAQRTFLACVERRASFEGRAGVRAYIYGIAHKELLRHFEGRGGGAPLADLSCRSIADLVPSPSRVIVGREEQRLVLDALQQLPLEFQIVIELFYWNRMSLLEIAETLEVAPGTVKSRLARARERLREQLDELAAGRVLFDLEVTTRALGDSLSPPDPT